MRRHITTVAIWTASGACCLLLCLACSEAGAPYTETVHDGIRVRTYSTQFSVPTNPYTVVPDVVFGTDQGEDTYLFRYVSPLGVGTDGSVLLRSGSVYRFTADGSFIGKIGASGQGPGEFSGSSSVLLDSDLLYVYDLNGRRRTVFDLSGAVLEMTPSPTDWGGSATGQHHPTAYAGSRQDRQTLGIRSVRSSMTNTFSFGIELRGPDMARRGSLIDTAFAYPVTMVGGNSVWPAFTIGFTAYALANDLPVAWSRGETFRVDFIDPLDRSKWAVVIPHEAIPVTSAHRETYLTGRYEQRGLVGEARREIRFPDTMPHLESMLWDDTGRLWVLEYRYEEDASAPFRYYVFDREGSWLFVQTLPGAAGRMIGDQVFISGELETGDPVVRSYRLEEG